MFLLSWYPVKAMTTLRQRRVDHDTWLVWWEDCCLEITSKNINTCLNSSSVIKHIFSCTVSHSFIIRKTEKNIMKWNFVAIFKYGVIQTGNMKGFWCLLFEKVTFWCIKLLDLYTKVSVQFNITLIEGYFFSWRLPAW